jgi:crotonobetainyl-CoA:carnitine CoA-transferase CaiB-like acyl-CoA transferase
MGPVVRFAGFGNLAAALSGFYEITGWPDRDPVGLFGAYTDCLAPRFGLVALLAALEHRRRPGQGQYIDLSQAESALHFYSQAFLDFQMNGRVMSSIGNSDLYCAPHGVYRVAGDHRWIAIACETNEQWESLCAVMGRTDLARDSRFSSAENRVARTKELDRLVDEWTAAQDPLEPEAKLQSRGVPAHYVATGTQLAVDPQLAFRDHFVKVPHQIHGSVVIEGTRFQLSRSPAVLTKAGPTLGQHTQLVFKDLLGYNDDKIAELVACGAIG